ncbi:MAG: tetraacyldisaccharide 4'-kinase [Pseudomonadota bacterium]
MGDTLQRLWYTGKRPLGWLAPLASLYGWLVKRRRQAYREGRRAVHHSPFPVLVVGNITVGGTGKSPFTAWLVGHLKASGWRPVILSRGYGAKPDHYPCLVGPESDPADCGDEPVMLAQQTGVHVLVDPKRSRAATYVEQQRLGDVLICDDGLQHYALARTLEFCIFDGARGVGNGALMPVGPLREPLERAGEVDFCLSTGEPSHPSLHSGALAGQHLYPVDLVPTTLRNLATGDTQPLEWLNGRVVNGVAGIGNPGRFFDTLDDLGARVIPHPFDDHHRFHSGDLDFPHGPVVMTAKDGVKCGAITGNDLWVLDVIARPDAALVTALDQQLKQPGKDRTHG